MSSVWRNSITSSTPTIGSAYSAGMASATLPPGAFPALAPLPGRDPARMLAETRRRWGGRSDLWVFGYASLIWRPGFDAAEHRTAVVHGWHRALQMRSRVNRGTPDTPGLVCAMVSGGSCRGVVYRIEAAKAEAELGWRLRR